MLKKIKREFEKATVRYPNIFGKILGEFPLQVLGNRYAENKDKTKTLIPRVVYQTWENKEFGKTHFKYLIEFRNQNLGFDFGLYDANERLKYLKKSWGKHPILDIYKKCQFGAMQADIWRYCILYEFGGIYFDISKKITIPINQLFDLKASAVVTYELNEEVLVNPKLINVIKHPHNTMAQWGFGFAPKHPFLEKTINNIVKYYPVFKNQIFGRPKNGIHKFTGPGMFTKSVTEVLLENSKIKFQQIGLSFDSFAILSIPRSWIRHSLIKTYWLARNAKIVI